MKTQVPWYQVLLLALGLLLAACGQQGSPENMSAEAKWSQALQDIEKATGVRFVLDEDLPEEFLQADADSNFQEQRAYREADGLGEATARLFVWKHDPSAVNWYVRVPDLKEKIFKVYHSDGSVEREPFSAEFEKAYGKLRFVLTTPSSGVVTPNGNDDGGGGSAGNCVDYCAIIERTYRVRKVTVTERVVQAMSVAACRSVGGSIGGPAGGAVGSIICTYIVTQVIDEVRLVRTRCIREDTVCSSSPYQAPRVPKPQYRDRYIRG